MLAKPLKVALDAARGAVLTAPLACSSPAQAMMPAEPAAAPRAHPQPFHDVDAHDFDVESLQELMRSMVGELRSAQTPEDLDWVLSDVIAGGPLEDFFAAAIAALPHVPREDFEISTETLDPELRDAVHRSLLSTQVVLALRQTSTERPSALAELLRGEGEPLSLQELLYGELLPPAVQQALYAGHVSYLTLLTLLDDGLDDGLGKRPTPQWLRAELRRRLVANQGEYLRLLVAYAKKEGVTIPEALASIEPLDLDAAEREADAERHAVDAYLDGHRAVRDRS